jgi:hypothetical protein
VHLRVGVRMSGFEGVSVAVVGIVPVRVSVCAAGFMIVPVSVPGVRVGHGDPRSVRTAAGRAHQATSTSRTLSS